MREKKIWHNSNNDLLVMLPATIMALLPFSVEERLHFDFLGYKTFALMPIGMIAVIISYSRNYEKGINFWLLILALWGLLSTIMNVQEDLLAHYLVGIEFIVGYFFAAEMRYSNEVLKMIKKIALLIFILVIIQLVSFSLSLGYFSSGQAELESLDGMLRAGSTLGGPTLTGAILVLLVGLVVTLSSNEILNYFYLSAGLIASLLTGTRSTMIVMIAMLLIYAFRETRRNILFIAVGVVFLVIYVYPKVEQMIETREELARMQGFDVTSGRVEKWNKAFKILNNNSLGYELGMGGGTVPINTFQDIRMLSSPHNAFIGILFQYGIPGMIFFLLFLWRKLKKLFRKLTVGSVTLLGSVLVCWNVEIITLSFMYCFFFWLLYFVELRKYKTANL